MSGYRCAGVKKGERTVYTGGRGPVRGLNTGAEEIMVAGLVMFW